MSTHNLYLAAGERDLAGLMADAKEGLYVTSMFGPSFNANTGDWSTGVSGFWFENGEIAYPVSVEITIAGNLLEMYRRPRPRFGPRVPRRDQYAVAAGGRGSHRRTMSPALEDLALLGDAAREAGALALSMRARGLKIWSKKARAPRSPTPTRRRTGSFLKQRLLGARPDYGWLSEETADDPARLKKQRIFVVDPIDGTAAFMKSRPWWSVALAVVEVGQPIAAVVFAPQVDEFAEAALGEGARRNGQAIQASDADTLEDAAVLADAKLLERPIWPEPWPAMRVEKRNSIAYRMTLVAAGVFDAAIALGRKWDWDVCAGTLIATEAGAKVSDHRRPTPSCSTGRSRNRPAWSASAPALQPLILLRCAPIQAPD